MNLSKTMLKRRSEFLADRECIQQMKEKITRELAGTRLDVNLVHIRLEDCNKYVEGQLLEWLRSLDYEATVNRDPASFNFGPVNSANGATFTIPL